MEQKTYRAPIEFKSDGETGEFSAVFATLLQKDHDGDVTLPGAFGEQFVVIEPYNHNFKDPPVGKGVISEVDDTEAVVKGRFFTETAAGKDHYLVAKELNEKQEWSYSFNILDAEDGVHEGEPVRLLKRLEVIGVGQVTRGAGINTRLLAIKSAEQEPEIKEETTDDTQTEGEASDGKPSGDVQPDFKLKKKRLELYKLEVQNNEH